MKMILATLVLAASTTAFAQAKKMSPPPPKTAPPVKTAPAIVSSTPSYSTPSHSSSEITGNFGFVAGAITIGGTYVKQFSDFGFGGYAFIQSSKDKNSQTVVSGVTAFGALVKVNVYENNSFRAYLAPGFGFAMIKDASLTTNAVTGETKKSDENLISPTFKMGVQYKTQGNLVIGLERMQFANWLNDSLNNYAGPAEYYTVAASFGF